jgi:DNA helicase-4
MQDLGLFPILVIVTSLLLAVMVFSYYFRAYRRRKIEERLSQYRSDINQAHLELNVLLNSDRYVDRKTINIWISKWFSLFPILKDYRRYKNFDADLDEKIGILFMVFDNSEKAISERNEVFIEQEAKRFEWLFNSIEKYPLTTSQIRSIVTDEYFNLVVAGAGTGKTSTLVGKAAYILRKGLAKPNEVLLLSFARDAKEEMYKRTNSHLKLDLDVKTFHSLGLSIIAEVEGKTPSVSKLATDKVKLDNKIEEFIKDNFHDELFSKLLNEYFLFHLHPYESIFNFKNRGEYIDYLKNHEVRSLKGDVVKSFEECEIANFLYLNGIQYEYERDYEVVTASRKHRQYRPDFYLTDYGIYIEHFAIDEKGNTPSFIDKNRYAEEIVWKRNLHRTNETKLIETYSYEKTKGMLLTNLEEKLQRQNVEFKRIPKEKVFEEINKLGYISPFSSLLATFLNLYKSSHLEIKDLKEKANKSRSKERSQAFVDIFSYILTSYNNYLISLGEVDFNDMISLSERYVAENRYQAKYRYILVDEFQDVSQSRYRLLKTLLEQSPDCKLFCVGDDWQSIFRFTGSDLSLMTNFQEYFGFTKLLILDKTFRFNDKICDFSSKFILQNPNQIPKRLSTKEKAEKQTVKVIFNDSESDAISQVLEDISSKSLKKTEVFIIGRYNYQLPENLDELKRRFPRISIKTITAHSSKGTESDYVILIGMKSGLYGFPCQIVDDPLLDLVLAKQDSFPNSEERRLFYVAVTRAKKEVYLLADTKFPSQFITEVLHQDYNLNVTGENTGKMKCPECKTGNIEPVRWKDSTFYSCSNYPYCRYRPQVCPKCDNGFLHKENETEYTCINDYCNFRAVICPSCNDGYMKLIKGPYSDFMGCSNFPDCRYKE